MIGILKLVRMVRLGSLIQKLDLTEEIKAVSLLITNFSFDIQLVRVAYLTFLLMFYFHLCACAWFYEASYYQIWIPPLDFNNISTDVFVGEMFLKYVTCLHYAVLLLTGNESGPRTELEIIMSLVFILAGAIITAQIFGEMTVLVQIIQRRN